MRIIKFRAWDKEEKEMLPVITGMHIAMVFENPKKFIPLQFTGLTDKNGKEIYEGDILKFMPSNVENPQFTIGVVHYSETDARYKVDYWSFGTDVYFSNMEIIGNIYENPNLLEEKREG